MNQFSGIHVGGYSEVILILLVQLNKNLGLGLDR